MMPSFIPQVRSRTLPKWHGKGRFEFRKEAQAFIAAKGESIIEARILESPDKPNMFWDPLPERAWPRGRGFKHSPMQLAQWQDNPPHSP